MNLERRVARLEAFAPSDIDAAWYRRLRELAAQCGFPFFLAANFPVSQRQACLEAFEEVAPTYAAEKVARIATHAALEGEAS